LRALLQAVLAVYGLHWIDPSTLEFLELAVERVQRLPIMAIITFRPEFAPSWSGRTHVTSLALGRLAQRQGTSIIEAVTGGKTLPVEVAEQIVTKTDGIPLFIEELTKTLLESGFLREAGDRYVLSGPLPAMAIPTTIHDSLLARLDRLGPAKETAQIGAALGREFSYELLAAVTQLSEGELDDAIAQLTSAELVFRRGRPPHATYTFKHALIQDAASRYAAEESAPAAALGSRRS
jgi:predicted ATPase